VTAAKNAASGLLSGENLNVSFRSQ